VPHARKLFRKAILQSGNGSCCQTLDNAAIIAEEFVASLGIKKGDYDTLRTISTEQLLAAQRDFPLKLKSKALFPWKPVIDGTLLKEMPLSTIEKGAAQNMPVLIGTNLEEWKFWNTRDPELPKLDWAGLKARCKQYIPSEHIDTIIETCRTALLKRGVEITPAEIFCAIQTDGVFRIPALRFIEAQRKYGAPVYNYLFSWRPSQHSLGACHCLELGFVFGSHEEKFCGSGPVVDAIAQNIQDAWLAFARASDPNCNSLGSWPACSKKGETMVLDAHCRMEEILYENESRAWSFISNATWSVP
jgi:para-nitrobenzyl esterase